MALTVTWPNDNTFSVGSKIGRYLELAFDSSYLFGGEALTAATMGFDTVDRVIIESQRGYHFEWDSTNEKVKVLHQGPPVVVEEQHILAGGSAGNTLTLDYPPAYIMNVCSTGVNIPITTVDATVGSGECKPTAAFAWDTRGGLTFHTDVTATVFVTYATQAWLDVWTNLVQDEAGTAATHVVTLANDALAIQAITGAGGTAKNAFLMVDKDDTPVTGECSVDWTDNTSTTLTFAAADAITASVCTYVKNPGSGWLFDHWVEEESSTGASNICTPVKPIALWGYAGQLVDNGQVTEKLIEINGSQGTNEGWIDFHSGTKIDYNIVTTATLTYIGAHKADIPTVPIQVMNGWDLSLLTAVRITVIGT